MKLTKKLLEQYIREVMKESWRSRYRKSSGRSREMNYGVGSERGAQSDWYADDDYKPPPAPVVKSNLEKATMIWKGGTNERMLSAIIKVAKEMAPSVEGDASRDAAIEEIAEEVAAQFTNNFSTITKDSLLSSKGRVIKAMLDAAVKDHLGIPPEQFGA